MWVVFKVFVEFITILFLLFFFFFGYEAHGILAPKPGIESTPRALKGKVLTTGLPGTMLLPHLVHIYLPPVFGTYTLI